MAISVLIAGSVLMVDDTGDAMEDEDDALPERL